MAQFFDICFVHKARALLGLSVYVGFRVKGRVRLRKKLRSFDLLPSPCTDSVLAAAVI